MNYEHLKTEKNKENHKVTHSAQSFYGKVRSAPSEKWSNSDISTRCNFFIIWSRKKIKKAMNYSLPALTYSIKISNLRIISFGMSTLFRGNSLTIDHI